uniref:ABC transporter domain-containing protein n=1 Tax=Schistocephalus solidus TaxID=70667 RepID=A0A0V0J2F1_SCHSO
MGKALPEIEAIARALSAAEKVYPIIDRIPNVDIASDGNMLPELKGKIEFKNLSFAYPTRPTVQILKDFNLTVEPGQKVAIVGLSGSGKSTAIHLLQRFYDPASGEVLLDDHNVQNLHLGWLRQQLGVVAQEADIFTGTVADNIRIGSIDASDEEIEAAAILANAHEFIMKFPQGYDTWLDEGGAKLSGGQRQRIAIARALVRKPKILLLDEATSALDTRSERAVQQALDTACAGRSVIMVAHRLTTVRNADKIVVMQEGEVVETGTHDELKQAKGRYWKMLQAQNLANDDNTDTDLCKSDEGQEKSQVDMIKKKVDDCTEENNGGEAGGEDMVEEECMVKPSLSLKERFPMFAALRLNRPEYPYLFIGLLMAIAVGIIEPLFALVYSEMFEIFKHILRPKKMQARANELALGMLFLGAMRMIATFFQVWFISACTKVSF